MNYRIGKLVGGVAFPAQDDLYAVGGPFGGAFQKMLPWFLQQRGKQNVAVTFVSWYPPTPPRGHADPPPRKLCFCMCLKTVGLGVVVA